jgi:TonB family protein
MTAATLPAVSAPFRADAAQDHAAARLRTRRTMLVSMLLHTLLFAWLVLSKAPASEIPEITEIVMLDPADLVPAAPSSGAPAAAGKTAPGAPVASNSEERFQREEPRAAVTPDPQSAFATQDRIAARLASLQERSHLPAQSPTVSGVPSGMLGAPAGVGTPMGGAGTSLSLQRGGSTGSAPLALSRGGTGTSAIGPAVVATGIPKEASAEPAIGGAASARRQLAGATLMGPIADRRIVQSITPVYPDWAKRDAVEGAVTLYFIVRSDGSIKENVLVQKTAGFEDFDENARAALRAWRFEPLGGGRTGEQWGTITFHFRLRENGTS